MSSDPSPPAAPAAPPLVNGMDVDERFELMRSVGEECVTDDELRKMLANKPVIRCYDGFEPSGRMHIAQGIFKAVNVNKCTKAGCTFVFWVADWFALMNDKMGGSIDNIRLVGEYLVHVWTAAGMDMSNNKVQFLWSSDEINAHAEEYWKRVLDIGRCNSLARIKKCCQIMGRLEGNLTSAQILYPLMQCADVFFLKADICQLGLDQRKVNMLAREYCDSIGRKLKPVVLSHHMLAGLKAGQAKMSKSDPDSAIFMEDPVEEVVRKIGAAYCPKVAQIKGEVSEDGAPTVSDEKNPCLDYLQSIIFSTPGTVFTVSGRVFTAYADFERAFLGGEINEVDFKCALAAAINALLEPVREHFRSDAKAAAVFETIKSLRNLPKSVPAAVATEALPPCGIAWLPASFKLDLDSALGIVSQLNAFVVEHGPNSVVLVQPDWACFARNDCVGDEKAVGAALDYHVFLLRAFGLREDVRVARQSKAILQQANEYFLTVIAAGRTLPLGDIEAVFNNAPENAGQVISTLMRVADTIAFKATNIIPLGAATSELGALEERCAKLTQTFFAAQGRPPVAVGSLRVPTVLPLVQPSTPFTAADVLMADDSEQDVRTKLKKAYAAPSEGDNAVIRLVTQLFMMGGKPFKVSRSEANGGEKVYVNAESLVADCAEGLLHPADLKAAVGPPVLELMKGARECQKKAEVKNAATVVKNAEKRSEKKK